MASEFDLSDISTSFFLVHFHSLAHSFLFACCNIFKISRWFFSCSLHRYERALDLAAQHRVHQDSVLFFRNQHLASMGRKETDRRFLQLAEQGVAATLQGVQDKIAKEEAAERNRPGASSGGSGSGGMGGAAGDSSSYASLSGILGVDSFGKVPTLSFSVAPRAAAAAATAAGGATGEERGGGGDDDQQ